MALHIADSRDRLLRRMFFEG